MSNSDADPLRRETDRPRPAGKVPWESVPLGPGFAVLARVLQVALVVVTLLMAARVALSFWGIAAADDEVAIEGSAWFADYDQLDALLSLVTVAALILTAALWMTWQFQLARSASPGELTRSPVWHVTSWVIPVLGLWWPYQNVRDLWWLRSRGWGAATVGWWWAAVIAALLVDQMVRAAGDNVEAVQDFQDLLVLQTASAVAAVIAGALAVHIQSRLSSRPDDVTPEGRPAA